MMNTRGPVELIDLSIGLDHKVLSPTRLALTVLTLLATTLARTPLLSLVQREAKEGERGMAPSRRVSHCSLNTSRVIRAKSELRR